MSTTPRVRRSTSLGSALRLRFNPAGPLSRRLFAGLCRFNPDLRLESTAEGELVILTPAGTDSAARGALLTLRLGLWSESNGLGKFFDATAGFTLPNGAVRSPDASWVSLERWNALTTADQRRFAPLCPDFAVELRSPTDRLGDLRFKMREYRAQGCRLGWLIDPSKGRVTVYRPGRPTEVLDGPTSLSGEDVLPGFVLDLKGILTG